MLRKFYPYRFELLFFSQILILFGSLFFPLGFYEVFLSPIIFILNLLASVILFLENKTKMWMVITLLIVAIFCFGIDVFKISFDDSFTFLHLGTFFLFYILLTVELVGQVWSAKRVGKNVILGLISGYISLGLLGFFICMIIEMATPGSFSTILESSLAGAPPVEKLIYYSYITLMTIGYGEIVPLTTMARKASIFIGLMGQIYSVILTAIIVGKYISQRTVLK